MPTYLYRCEKCSTTITKIVPVAKMRRRVKCECGASAGRDIVAEHSQVAHKPGNWPLTSDAAGVHPDQAGEAYSQSVSMGVPTQFNANGQAIFTSARHRKAYCERVGIYDKSGGYSDPQRRR